MLIIRVGGDGSAGGNVAVVYFNHCGISYCYSLFTYLSKTLWNPCVPFSSTPLNQPLNRVHCISVRFTKSQTVVTQ